MSRSFITDMQHFIDEKGTIPESMPRQARQFVENIGNIVISVTGEPNVLGKAVVSCWNKINGKRCSGKIDAGIDLGSLNILWHCLKCGDNGSISNWEHTLWSEDDNGIGFAVAMDFCPEETMGQAAVFGLLGTAE